MSEESNIYDWKIWLKGLCTALIISLVLILLLSIILSVTDIKEGIINPGIIFISSFSILIASFQISKKLEKKGILNGCIFGIFYIILLYLVSSICNGNFSLNVTSIILSVTGIVSGMLGGVLGVNLK